MIKKVLVAIVISLALVFVLIWVWKGGLTRTWQQVRDFPGLGAYVSERATSSQFRLPWQFDVPTIAPSGPESAESTGAGSPQGGYEIQNAPLAEVKNAGTPSPSGGSVRISALSNPKESNPRAEYIIIEADDANTAPVSITGWSLQGAAAGKRMYVPRGAESYALGEVNITASILLNPGASAMVSSGLSPLGISFRENLCTGYLSQLQEFTPPLSLTCPAPSSVLPLSEENLRRYGEACFDFLSSVPTCTSPYQSLPANVTPQCRGLALEKLSYNGCVSMSRSRPDFASDSWRVYLGSATELWGNSHDVIRLLDAQGRTVDTMTY